MLSVWFDIGATGSKLNSFRKTAFLTRIAANFSLSSRFTPFYDGYRILMGMGNSQPEQKTKGTQRTKGRPGQLQSLKSLSSLKDGQPTSDTFIPPHGGYQQLLSYQKALVVFDCHTLLLWPLHRQEIPHPRPDGAGRPVRQAKHPRRQRGQSATSKETEIKLTNVAQRQPEGTARRPPRFYAQPRH